MVETLFNLKPSRYYLYLLLITIGLSAAALIYSPLSLLFATSLFFLLLTYAAYLIWHAALLKSPQAIRAIKRLPDGRWQLLTREHIYTATLCGDSTLTSWVTLLRFRLQGSVLPRSCLIFRDALTQAHYRRLQVTLRLEN